MDPSNHTRAHTSIHIYIWMHILLLHARCKGSTFEAIFLALQGHIDQLATWNQQLCAAKATGQPHGERLQGAEGRVGELWNHPSDRVSAAVSLMPRFSECKAIGS